MKRAIALLCTALFLSGCASTNHNVEATTMSATEPVAQVENAKYVTRGRYYAIGELATNDGNVWGYSTDTISDKPSYDHEPVYAVFSDNGTPDNIYDDEVIGLVLDIEAEIYDKLEAELSKSFTVERSGNIISVSTP